MPRLQRLVVLLLFGAALPRCSDTPSSLPDAGAQSDAKGVDGTPLVDTIAIPDGEATQFSITWTAEKGNVVEDATNAGAKVDTDDSVLLLYQDQSKSEPGDPQRVVRLKEDSDWLTPSDKVEMVVQAFHAVLLPNGLYRAYGGDPTLGGGAMDFGSWSSTDGVTFTRDVDDKGAPIIRYQLQPEDKGKMGTYDLFVNSDKHVVLLYVADNQAGGKNNIRRAISTDGGDTFAFDRGNILGDDNANGGGNTYVDQDTLILPDGRVYLIAMKSGIIYHFLGDPKGETFVQLSQSPILLGQMFEPVAGTKASTLHDPQIVRLSNGRLRIYLAGQVADETGPSGKGKHYMLAATSNAF